MEKNKYNSILEKIKMKKFFTEVTSVYMEEIKFESILKQYGYDLNVNYDDYTILSSLIEKLISQDEVNKYFVNYIIENSDLNFIHQTGFSDLEMIYMYNVISNLSLKSALEKCREKYPILNNTLETTQNSKNIDQTLDVIILKKIKKYFVETSKNKDINENEEFMTNFIFEFLTNILSHNYYKYSSKENYIFELSCFVLEKDDIRQNKIQIDLLKKSKFLKILLKQIAILLQNKKILLTYQDLNRLTNIFLDNDIFSDIMILNNIYQIILTLKEKEIEYLIKENITIKQKHVFKRFYISLKKEFNKLDIKIKKKNKSNKIISSQNNNNNMTINMIFKIITLLEFLYLIKNTSNKGTKIKNDDKKYSLKVII